MRSPPSSSRLDLTAQQYAPSASLGQGGQSVDISAVGEVEGLDAVDRSREGRGHGSRPGCRSNTDQLAGEHFADGGPGITGGSSSGGSTLRPKRITSSTAEYSHKLRQIAQAGQQAAQAHTGQAQTLFGQAQVSVAFLPAGDGAHGAAVHRSHLAYLVCRRGHDGLRPALPPVAPRQVDGLTDKALGRFTRKLKRVKRLFLWRARWRAARLWFRLDLFERKGLFAVGNVTVKQVKKLEPEQRRARILRVAKRNLENTLRIMWFLDAHGFKVYRLSANLVPLATHEITGGWAWWKRRNCLPPAPGSAKWQGKKGIASAPTCPNSAG